MKEKLMAFSETLKTRIRNVHTYVITPFKDDASMTVDMDALRDNLQFSGQPWCTSCRYGRRYRRMRSP